MARQATIPTQTEQRNVRFRIVGAKPTQMRMMRGHAGMTRFVWNTLLARIQDEDKAYAKAKKKGEKYTYHHDTYSKFGLCKHADAVKREKGLEWLGDYSAVAVRGAALALTRAYKAYRKKKMTKEDIERGKGKPKFKAKRGDDWFRYEGTPIKCYGNTLQLPKVSTKHTKTVRLQRKGGNPYDGLPVKAVTVKQQGKRWYATVCYELTVPVVLDSDLKTAVGADLGVAQQVTLSNGEYARARDLAKLETKRKRHQRRASRQQGGSTWKKKRGYKHTAKIKMSNRRRKTFSMLASVSRKIKNIRDHDTHVLTRQIADGADVVVVEDLNTQGMTRRGKKKNVKAKSGLNRNILANSWGDISQKLDYKAKRFIAVNPMYTSQTCNACGHIDKENRPTQAKFVCTACGHKANADVNAAKNILARGLEEFDKARNSQEHEASVVGASGRRGAFRQKEDFNDPSTANLRSSSHLSTGLKPITHYVLRL